MPRWLLPLVAFGVLALPATANAAAPDLLPDVRLGPGLRIATPPPDYWGGEYVVPSGARVAIYASPSVQPENQADNQDVADFLDSALHGSEISSVEIWRVSTDEIARLCGSPDALACYDPGSETIVTPADDSGDVTAKSALLHEFGHHIANARLNLPWHAIDRGPKRWSTYENVCAQTKAGHMFPGAEANLTQYQLNPGEGWAESYRVLNEQRLGLPPFPWQAVSRRFYPNATALRLVQEDVLHPWLKRTTSTIAGRLAASRTRTYSVSTPLDGTFTVTAPAGLRLTVLGSTPKTKTGARTVNTLVCGQRTLRVRVTANRTESYALRVTRP